MMPWFKLQKRQGNATLRGIDLGPKPKLEIEIQEPPKPKTLFRKLIIPKDKNVSK